ncbi:MAG TPA: hypothetical protein VMB21_00805 [Candidatus Limnocylindria bacterium]|jgi:hypothetical protein|nr:hypothetical protein [Candidatus Limnocylindria bacterium]
MANEQEEKASDWESFRFAGLLCAVGVGLALVVFLTPDATHRHFRSLLTVARSSPWQHWGDWAAAWCSFKIILLSLAGFLILFPHAMVLQSQQRKTLPLLILATTPLLFPVYLAGVYYLIKSLF